jgi:hypothetical protein
VLQLEVLVGEAARAVDGGRPGPVAVEKVAALDHEVLDLAPSELVDGSTPSSAYHTMELGALVSDRAAVGPARLARAELPEVLGRPGHDVLEELHLDAAERLACAISAHALSPITASFGFEVQMLAFQVDHKPVVSYGIKRNFWLHQRLALTAKGDVEENDWVYVGFSHCANADAGI